MNIDLDPIPLAQALIRRPSVTPAEAGALDLLEGELAASGFVCRRLRFGEVDNLYAKRGTARPNFCFAGHIDVVPPGEGWSIDPFAGEIRDGELIGRGAADMKTAIAAMVTATQSFLRDHPEPAGAISFLFTSDEEGPGIDGTKRVLEALKAEGEALDHCIVGEPTSESTVADVIKNGRRGSLNVVITLEGRQGHVAYPQKALNPVTPLLEILSALKSRKLDDGAPGFDPSNLEVTTIDVGNAAHNVIPSRASAKLNIRFNTRHTPEALSGWIRETADAIAGKYGAQVSLASPPPSHPFYTTPGDFTALVERAVVDTFQRPAVLSTTGGTSDARFIKDMCPVAELGLTNATAHMVDERVPIEDVRALARCYRRVLELYFE